MTTQPSSSIIEGPQFGVNTRQSSRRPLLVPIFLSVVATAVLVTGIAREPKSTTLTPNADVLQDTAVTVVDTTVPGTVTVNPPNAGSATITIADFSAFVLEAQTGDGITHLARRAVTRYVEEQSLNATLTPAHRIYMEDYIQNRIGIDGIEPGDEISVELSLLSEAARAAKTLTPVQLENLQQYVALVPELVS